MTSNFFAWGPVCQNEVDSKEEKQPEATESCSVEFFQIWPQKARLLMTFEHVKCSLTYSYTTACENRVRENWHSLSSFIISPEEKSVYVFWLMLIGRRDS